MKKEEIIENDILIAKFMGISIDKTLPFGDKKSPYGYAEEHQIGFNDEYYDNELLFFSSWDWLMPVVEKIEGLNTSFDICYICVHIETENQKFTYDCVGETKIEAVYKGVIKFIKWYNKNKSK